jgi:hypothetical protein
MIYRRTGEAGRLSGNPLAGDDDKIHFITADASGSDVDFISALFCRKQ